MFCKALLITLALALIAAASPVEARSAAGIRIPLGKRESLTNADGTFNREKAVKSMAKTVNKHRANLINLERNVGRQAFNEGAEIKHLATAPSMNVTKRQNEPLTEEDLLEWAGMISIGIPIQKFLVDFDTGTADLWVPSSSCRSLTCSHKRRYTPSSSFTSADQRGSFHAQDDSGDSVFGDIYTDTVHIAGVTVENQYFSPVFEMSSDIVGHRIDGILGLAYPAVSNLGKSPFFNTAISQGAVAEGVFGFMLGSPVSELYLGGIDSNLYTGAIEYHSVDTSSGLWQLSGASAYVGSKAVVSNFKTVIDSGTTLMIGPSSAVEALYASVGGSKTNDIGDGFYTFPCNATPSAVSFGWGGQKWSVSAESFNLGQFSLGSDRCVGALAGLDTDFGDDVWVLGVSFMRNVYTVFSFDDDTVGFAALA